MAAVVRGILRSIREKGAGSFLKGVREEGYLQKKIHNIGATLVGVDKFGNKYYEKLENTQYGRHRWVEYAEKGKYDASQVPAEWHGWLHHIIDRTGDEDTSKKSPMELINEVPPIKIEGRIVACEGDSNIALGHPIEYICLDLKDPAVCKYCGLRYVQADHHH